MPRRRSPRTGFEQRFLASLRDAGIESGARLTIGFSGGADSLALACAARAVAPLLDLQLLLVHVDHRLRPTSGEGAAACRELAEHIGIEIRIETLEDGLAERAHGIGIEEAARRERYMVLAEAARDWGSTAILLGHQANDQAETVLLHLFRGAGLSGLAGMRSIELRAIPWWSTGAPPPSEFRLVRPLLSETRSVIEEYVAEFGFIPIEDESNASLDFDRNWIRHRVLPATEERWPAVVQTLARSTRLFQIDDAYLQRAVRESGMARGPAVRTLSTDGLISSQRAVAFRSIRSWLLDLGVEEPRFDVVARVHELAESGDEQSVVQVGMGRSVVVANGRLMTAEELEQSASDTFPILVSGDRAPSWTIEIGDSARPNAIRLRVPAHTRLNVRPLAPGDRWYGTNRSVFEDVRVAGIHPILRSKLLSIATDDGVLLIPAIYPNIRANVEAIETKVMGVEWSKAK